jgi:DnaK suppressor protein
MTKSEIERFRRQLESSRENVIRFLGQLGNETRSVDPGGEWGNQGLSVSNPSKELSTQPSSDRRQLLRTIDAALPRISEGTFGMCAQCGNEIHSMRFEALPWTEYCIDCQQIRDARDQEGRR